MKQVRERGKVEESSTRDEFRHASRASSLPRAASERGQATTTYEKCVCEIESNLLPGDPGNARTPATSRGETRRASRCCLGGDGRLSSTKTATEDKGPICVAPYMKVSVNCLCALNISIGEVSYHRSFARATIALCRISARVRALFHITIL